MLTATTVTDMPATPGEPTARDAHTAPDTPDATAGHPINPFAGIDAHDRYSLNRLAALSGWAEASLRRLCSTQERIAEIMDMHDFRLAVAAARALRYGHDPACIRALNALPQPLTSMWLITCPGAGKVTSTMTKAMAFIEDHPSAVTWQISSVGDLVLGVEGM